MYTILKDDDDIQILVDLLPMQGSLPILVPGEGVFNTWPDDMCHLTASSNGKNYAIGADDS